MIGVWLQDRSVFATFSGQEGSEGNWGELQTFPNQFGGKLLDTKHLTRISECKNSHLFWDTKGTKWKLKHEILIGKKRLFRFRFYIRSSFFYFARKRSKPPSPVPRPFIGACTNTRTFLRSRKVIPNKRPPIRLGAALNDSKRCATYGGRV